MTPKQEPVNEVEQGRASAAMEEKLSSFTVNCFAVVRVTFPGIIAASDKDAARRVIEQFDWDVHGSKGEYTGEWAGVRVDADGDDNNCRTVEFDATLQRKSFLTRWVRRFYHRLYT